MTCAAARDVEFVRLYDELAVDVSRRRAKRRDRDDYAQEARIGLLRAAREPSIEGVSDAHRVGRKARIATARLWLRYTPGMTTPARFGGRKRAKPHRVDGGLDGGCGLDMVDDRSEDGVRSVDACDACSAALAEIDERQKLMVEMYFGLGRPAQDTPRIAATLGLAKSTVARDIQLALDKMRRKLTRERRGT